jgi:hypothetical protein
LEDALAVPVGIYGVADLVVGGSGIDDLVLSCNLLLEAILICCFLGPVAL